MKSSKTSKPSPKTKKRFRSSSSGSSSGSLKPACENFEKLKELAHRINNNAVYNGSIYVTGSMAIALHEENQNNSIKRCPNDLDLVLITKQALGEAPRILGMNSENQTATNGATFVDNVDESLSVDIIQARPPNENILTTINGLRVLRINELKKLYRDRATDNFAYSYSILKWDT